MNKLKISFIEPHLELYGGIRRIIELSNGLVNKGHDVTIYHSDGSECLWMKCLAEVKPAIEVLHESHDVLIFNSLTLPEYFLARFANSKIKILYVLGLYDKNMLLQKNRFKLYASFNIKMIILKRYLYSNYHILANSTWIHNWIKNTLYLESNLLLGGVNHEMFHPTKVATGNSSYKILYTGDPRESKGSSTVENAIQHVKISHDVEADFYYGKNIPQNKMAEFYGHHDLFIDGSLHGGWNNPVAEAMACKVPVICTNIGAVQDFAFHERTALLVPPNDSEKMASAIIRMLEDETLRDNIVENAFKTVSQFTWQKATDSFSEYLIEIIETTSNESYNTFNVFNRLIGIAMYYLFTYLFILKRFLFK